MALAPDANRRPGQNHPLTTQLLPAPAVARCVTTKSPATRRLSSF